MSATSTERSIDRDEASSHIAETAGQPVVVRRRAAMLLVLGGLASSLAIAFLWRATGSGSWVDALLCAVLGAMAAGYLTALIDARAPLLVIDQLGVRIRIGREWRGLPWEAVDRIWLLPREGLLRDARIVVVPSDLGHVVEGLDRGSLRSLLVTQRLHGAPLAMPVGPTTEVSGDPDLVARLRELAAGHDTVVADGAELTDQQASLLDARLTDAHVARRDAVVRALPGVAAPAATEVSHVALVPETDAAEHHEPEDLEGPGASDESEAVEARDFSVLGRIFDLKSRAEIAHVSDKSDESAAVVSLPAETTAEVSLPAETAAEVSLPAETAPRRSWWQALRDHRAFRRHAATESQPDADDQVVEQAAEAGDVVVAGQAEHADDSTDAAQVPAMSSQDVDPDGTAGSAGIELHVEPGEQHEADADLESLPPGMSPAAHISVSPLVPSRAAARRVEVIHRVEETATEGAAALDTDGARHGVHLLPETAALRPGSDDLLLGDASGLTDTSGATPLARPGEVVAPLQLGGFSTRPAYDPVIGPEVRAARTRLGFSIDELADRTRIRPHVLEAIEVDDFAPSGGDVYARGHLRTLGRILGKDAEVWVTQFESRYAHGPTTAKRVFEAELASAVRSPRGPRSGPHWSLVAAVVLALGVVWAAATSLSDEPVEVVTPAPLVAPEAGQQVELPAPAPTAMLQLRASDQPASVTVRDADGAVVLVTALQPGEMRRVRLSLPVRVLVGDGGPVSLRYAGKPRGQLAAPGVVVPGAEGEAALPSVRKLR